MLLSNWHCLATTVIWCWGREGGNPPRPSVPREGGRLASWSDWLQTQGRRLPRDYQIPPAAGTREDGSKGEIPYGLLPVVGERGEEGGGDRKGRREEREEEKNEKSVWQGIQILSTIHVARIQYLGFIQDFWSCYHPVSPPQLMNWGGEQDDI